MLLVVVHAMVRTGVIWLIMEGLLWSVNMSAAAAAAALTACSVCSDIKMFLQQKNERRDGGDVC